jgi:hypothetical protein
VGGGKAKMLSVSEVAQKIGAAKRSVQMWAQLGKFRGAKRVETPGGHYWLIPESALDGFEVRGRGRPPKAKSVAKRTDQKK